MAEAHTPTESGGQGPALGVAVKALSVVWTTTRDDDATPRFPLLSGVGAEPVSTTTRCDDASSRVYFLFAARALLSSAWSSFSSALGSARAPCALNAACASAEVFGVLHLSWTTCAAATYCWFIYVELRGHDAHPRCASHAARRAARAAVASLRAPRACPRVSSSGSGSWHAPSTYQDKRYLSCRQPRARTSHFVTQERV